MRVCSPRRGWLQPLCGLLSIAVIVGLAGCGGSGRPLSNPSKTIDSIKVSPNAPSIVAGATQQFTATATYSDGSTGNMSSVVTWTSATTTVAAINGSGLATGVAAGTSTITATVGGVNGTATLTVTAKTITSIAVTAASPSIAGGATDQFTATATYSDGSTGNITSTATWISSSTAVASINSAGLATGVAAGSTTITAVQNGVTGSAPLTVIAPVLTLTAITVTPATAGIAAGASQQFTATATFSDGSTANVTSTATWISSSTATATISASGVATGIASGTSTITASLSGVNGTAVLSVTAKTLTAIAVTPGTASIAEGAMLQFTATATYSDNSTANVTSTAAWSTASSSIATVNGSGLATAVAAGSTTVAATLNGVSGAAALSVKTITSIAVTPAPASFAAGSTQQLTATATYSDGSTSDITSTAAWSVANPSVATVNSSGLATALASGTTHATATMNGVTGTDSLTVTLAAGTAVDVTTWHMDNNRSGLNSNEVTLSPSNVTPAKFGKLFSYLLDGYAYGEPLLMSSVTINGASHNVVYVATEHDTVYAFDADNYGSGAPLWQTSLLNSGETPLTNGPIQPYEGVTSTPVIDRSTNTIYVVSAQTSSSTGGTFRLNALDIATGAQKPGSPVTLRASVPGTGGSSVNGVVSLNTSCLQRAALLLANSNVYIGFGSCHTGWLLAYDAQSFTQVGVFNSSPNLDGEGEYASAGGFWMGGGGPAADGAGNIYAVNGNGPWDGQTAWSDSVLKFNSTLQMEDYFTPDAYQYMDCADADFAAGGVLLIPGSTQIAVGGKTGKIYLLNTGNLGHEQTNDVGSTDWTWFESDVSAPYAQSCTDSLGTHTTDISSYEIFGTAAYYNNSIYLGVTPTTNISAGIRQFTFSGTTLTPGPYAMPSMQQNTRGTTPFISASSNNSNGIIWIVDQSQPIQNSGSGTPTNAVLRAYGAANFPNELYDSGVNSADMPGYGIKFTSPVVANGKVYISTGHDNYTTTNPKGELDVYGLK